ncbi:hypothetical protein GCM10022198_11490 [Klugiella xanthotipulae]|uniref:hypothetical protein n=1 Tax=Klugiella xanthotipulae TaxID=244735 RepID=UPI0014769F5F
MNGIDFVQPERLSRVTTSFNYIVDTDGQLLIAGQRYGHIDLSNGADVLAAGEFKLLDGTVIKINNASGHYKPYGPHAQEAFADSVLPVKPGSYYEVNR